MVTKSKSTMKTIVELNNTKKIKNPTTIMKIFKVIAFTHWASLAHKPRCHALRPTMMSHDEVSRRGALPLETRWGREGGGGSRAQGLKEVQPKLLVVTLLDIWPSPTSLEKKLYGSLGDLRTTAAFIRETRLGVSTRTNDEEDCIYTVSEKMQVLRLDSHLVRESGQALIVMTQTIVRPLCMAMLTHKQLCKSSQLLHLHSV